MEAAVAEEDVAELQLAPEFFQPLEEFDAVHHLLSCLPDTLSPTFLTSQTSQTQVILDAINSQLSMRVMRSYGAFVHGMAQVQQLESDMVHTAILCRSSRRHLGRVQSGMVEGSLRVLGKLRRKRVVVQLLRLARGLARLRDGIARLGTLLHPPVAAQTLPRAASLLRQCRDELASLRGVTLAQELAPRVGVFADSLIASLHQALTKASTDFVPPAFGSAMACAAGFLSAPDLAKAVQNSFVGAIKECTKEVLLLHVGKTGRVGAPRADANYKDLCIRLDKEYVDSCLAHTFEALVRVMHSLHQMSVWVAEAEAGEHADEWALVNDRASAASAAPGWLLQVRVSLEQMRSTVWELMQRRVAVFLGAAPMGLFTVEQHLDVVLGLQCFMKLGEAFSDADSQGLRTALRDKSRSFLAQYHRERLDELRMSLETESWQALPLQPGWSFCSLRELRSVTFPPRLQCHKLFHPPTRASAPTTTRLASSSLRYREACAFFGALASTASPLVVRTMGELLSSTDDDDANPAPASAPPDGPPPIVCSTALNVARSIGAYARIIRAIGVLAPEALRALSGLFELYLYVLFSVFWSGPPLGSSAFDEIGHSMPAPLKAMLQRIHTAMQSASAVSFDDSSTELAAAVRRTASSIAFDRLRSPLEDKELMALKETVVGMESLRGLSELLTSQCRALRSSLDATGARVLDGFLLDVARVGDLCKQMYERCAASVLVLEPVVSSIRNRSWALKEIGTQHNAYVDQLLEHLQQLSAKLRSTVPPEVMRIVMEGAIRHVSDQLVEGYSQTKKCSDEGRALMSLDVKTLQTGCRTLLPGQPLPMEYVENYIRALYLPSDQILEWAQLHPEYSVRQLSGLVSLTGVGATLKKKEHQELLQSLQELGEHRSQGGVKTGHRPQQHWQSPHKET